MNGTNRMDDVGGVRVMRAACPPPSISKVRRHVSSPLSGRLSDMLAAD